MIVMTKLWLFVKKHVLFIGAIVAGIVGVILFKKSPGDIAKTLMQIKQVHDDELKQLNVVEENRVELVKKNEQDHAAQLNKIEQDYTAQKSDLEKKNVKDVQNIVTSTNGDPKKLADVVALQTEFKVILPKDE